MIELQSVETSYSSELIRKGIHLCSLSIPVIYYYISKDTALSILIPLTLAFGLTDLARLFCALQLGAQGFPPDLAWTWSNEEVTARIETSIELRPPSRAITQEKAQ